MALTCFHCGQPVPDPGRWHSEVAGQTRPMCCAGCQAVTDAIVAAGLDDYYRTRTELPAPGWRPPQGLALAPGGGPTAGSDAAPDPAAEHAAEQALKIYDEPEVQARFVRRDGDHCEATLLVEGIRCGACVWLIERQLQAQPGVGQVSVNMATERATLRYDPRATPLSALLAAAARIGYRLRPFDPLRREQALRKASRAMFRRLFIAGLGMMQVMMYAIPVYLAEPGDIEPQWDALLRWASLVLTLPVVLYSAQPFFAGAWRDLRARSPGMDVPVAIALAAAFIASVHATFTGHGEVWFDSVTMFVFLLLGARYLEWMARRRAARTLDALSASVPDTAERIDPATGAADRVPASRLMPGDHFRVAPGERIAVDAVLLDDTTTIDQSLLTGESRPVPVSRGAELPGGSINTGHPVMLRALRAAGDSTISTIERLAERAAAQRPRIVGLTDRIARLFVVALLVLAAAVWLAWLQIDPSRAAGIAIAVLVVSCPCALSLATPAALAAAGSSALQRGMLVANSDLLLRAAEATDVVFDKTGTLTAGRPGLIALEPVPGAGERLGVAHRQDDLALEKRLLAIAAALEAGQSHPVAAAIRQAAAGLDIPIASQPRTVQGFGVQAVIDGHGWRLGSRAFAGELPANTGGTTAPRPDADADPGDTEVWLADESGAVARLRLRDTLRPEAAEVVATLATRGLQLHLLSGDDPATVARVAERLGIVTHRGGARPDDKLAYVAALQQAGRKVVMVGDGVNDAPVLAAADVSVAVGEASSLARTAAGVVLLGRQLTDLCTLLTLATDTRRIVRQNLGWAMAYNTLAIPAAAIGWVPPAVAAIGMSASSLLVAMNALRLLPRAERRTGLRPDPREVPKPDPRLHGGAG
ncbi:MAG: heavy metal translocating P-type ATPase [Burkholderiaceae bacterium]